jgi:hypothetical protein
MASKKVLRSNKRGEATKWMIRLNRSGIFREDFSSKFPPRESYIGKRPPAEVFAPRSGHSFNERSFTGQKFSGPLLK